jgi:hypothetical protein
VDSLLGIGTAGGKGKASASEGAMLASRLETLRSERAARAPELKQKINEPVAVGAGPRTLLGDLQRGAPPSRAAGNKRSARRKKGKR